MSVGPAITQDSWGATVVPLVAPGAIQVGSGPVVKQAVGDPLLSYGVSFFQTVANAYCAAAWNAPGVAPAVPPVRTAWTHDPRKFAFLESQLPALYMWRNGDTTRDQIAQDLRVSRGTLSLLWVPPHVGDEQIGRMRAPFPKALIDVLEDCFERGRDPNWVVAGDTNPDAAAYGSLLWGLMNFRRMHFQKWDPATISIPMESGVRVYEALMATLYVEELYTQGTGYSPLLVLDQKIQVTDQGFGDGGFTIAEGTEPQPT